VAYVQPGACRERCRQVVAIPASPSSGATWSWVYRQSRAANSCSGALRKGPATPGIASLTWISRCNVVWTALVLGGLVLGLAGSF